jgi:O-antigen/teichoic acid export membrane protein
MTALFFYFKKIEGAYLGAFALSAGVVAESLFSRVAVNKTLKKVLEAEHKGEDKLSFSSITTFYYPLALTSILSLGVNPLVTFFMGRSVMAIESLAVLPVVNSFIFIFRSVGLSMQEVIIAILSKGRENYDLLVKFIKKTAIILMVLLITIVFTPLIHIWFKSVSGLTEELSAFSITPVRILFVLPLLTLYISFQRSILVHTKNTSPVKWASAIEILLIILVLFITIFIFSLPGAIGAAIAYLVGRVCANIFLVPHQVKAQKKIEHG